MVAHEHTNCGTYYVQRHTHTCTCIHTHILPLDVGLLYVHHFYPIQNCPTNTMAVSSPFIDTHVVLRDQPSSRQERDGVTSASTDSGGENGEEPSLMVIGDRNDCDDPADLV